jgi:pyridoxal 5'-phosphate synthase pdxT subunit
MKVGVLALQGNVPEHRAAWAAVVGERNVSLVRTVRELDAVDALSMPGGESTTIARLLQKTGLWDELPGRIQSGFPIFATCAGLIVLARELEPSAFGVDPPTLGLLDVRVRRNDYGTQRESFERPIEVEGLRGPPYPGVFIRSPRILGVGPQAHSFVRSGDETVGVRAGPVWGLTFHPELTPDHRLHALFVKSFQRHR